MNGDRQSNELGTQVEDWRALRLRNCLLAVGLYPNQDTGEDAKQLIEKFADAFASLSTRDAVALILAAYVMGGAQ